MAGQKGATEKLVADIESGNEEVIARAGQMLQDIVSTDDGSTKLGAVLGSAPVSEPAVASSNTQTVVTAPQFATQIVVERTPLTEPEPGGDWAEQVQQQAIVTLDRLRLADGSTGWPFDKIFAARYLKGALKVRLVDPYLHLPHQVRNLGAFLLHVAETVHPKEIEIVTGFAPIESAAHQDRAFNEAARDLFATYGVTLTMHRDTSLHDRFVMLDHGVLFTLGRGLDIYKPATGLGVHRLANRRVRQTNIDVFCRPGHPFLSAQ